MLHLKSSSVKHTVYLNYGFMATSEPQKHVIIINKITVLWYSKKFNQYYLNQLLSIGYCMNSRLYAVL